MKKILMMLALLFCVGGCGDSKYDGKVMIDGDGNMYSIKHNIGDCHFIREIDPLENEKLMKYREYLNSKPKKSGGE